MKKLASLLVLTAALVLLTGFDFPPPETGRTVELHSQNGLPGNLPHLSPQEQMELKYDDGTLGGAFMYEKGNWYGVYFMPDTSEYPFRIDFIGLAFYDLEGRFPSKQFRLHILDDLGNPVSETLCTVAGGPESYFPNWTIVQLWQSDIVLADSFLVMVEYLGKNEPALCFDSSLNPLQTQPHSLMRDMSDDSWWWISYEGGFPDLIIRTVVTPGVDTPIERTTWGNIKLLYAEDPPR